MTWARWRFRDELVWVHVGATGAPELDADGRAEMKYREGDTRVYRPHPSNLQPATGETIEGGSGAEPSSRSTASAPRARRVGRARAKKTAPEAAAPRGTGAAVEIWTDGACTGNPGPMGIGMVVRGDGKSLERGEYLGHGTNNIAELTAISRGLELAAEIVSLDGRAINVYTDSSYAIGLLSQGWKAKANRELVAGIRQALTAFPQLRFVKVAGHAGIPDNERCDELGREAIVRRGSVPIES